MKFAKMRSVDRNIGEEVQWLAQERFVPPPPAGHSLYVNKERLNKFQPSDPTKLIMNGWYAYNGGFAHSRWPWHKGWRLIPHTNVVPLLISFHLTPKLYKYFSTGKGREFLAANAPIGCRDLDTMHFCESMGVPAYFSACLTLTIKPNSAIEKDANLIVASGLRDDEEMAVKVRTRKRVVSVDSTLPVLYSSKIRMDLARAMLGLYQSASCVVTGRLHCALPCLALGVPVLVVDRDKSDPSYLAGRYSGYETMLHHVSRDNLLNGNHAFSFDFPPENPDEHLQYRDNLVKRCVEFTGYDNAVSLLTIPDPMGYLVDVFTHTPRYRKGFGELWYTPPKEMVKVLLKRTFAREGWWDSKIR